MMIKRILLLLLVMFRTYNNNTTLLSFRSSQSLLSLSFLTLSICVTSSLTVTQHVVVDDEDDEGKERKEGLYEMQIAFSVRVSCRTDYEDQKNAAAASLFSPFLVQKSVVDNRTLSLFLAAGYAVVVRKRRLFIPSVLPSFFGHWKAPRPRTMRLFSERERERKKLKHHKRPTTEVVVVEAKKRLMPLFHSPLFFHSSSSSSSFFSLGLAEIDLSKSYWSCSIGLQAQRIDPFSP